jgi:phage baseplate assembly protein W
MATYIGFNTINTNQSIGYSPRIKYGKKVQLLDIPLVIQDLVNAFNIPQGSKPGNPAYGTTLWSFVFDPNVPDVRARLEIEIKRVASLDPRLVVNSVDMRHSDTGISISLEMAVVPFNNAQVVSFFLSNSGVASIV